MATTRSAKPKAGRAKPARRDSTRRPRAAKGKAAPARRRAQRHEPRLVPVRGAERRESAGVQLEIGRAGGARVKRCIYPVGFRWSVDMKPIVGTDLCMHAHVGFLASGAIRIDYPDGCTVVYDAPHVVAIDPGHDGAVVGDEPAVLIEFDFESETLDRLGMPASHRHA